jgi:hypothetical protein
MAVAPSSPHLVHRMRRPKDGTEMSSGHASTWISVL